MDSKHVIRAWKEPACRQDWDTGRDGVLPPHPSGALELDDADLARGGGGMALMPRTSLLRCGGTLICTLFEDVSC